MPRIVKVRLGDGREVDAMEVDFEIGREEWNEYRLLDGGKVRTKTVVHKIQRIVDDQGNTVLDDNGEPQMIVRNNVIVSVSE